MGLGGLKLPDRVISSEYLTIEGRKISTSRNWAIWVPYILENYNADSLRYFLTINAPEKRDGDFSWSEFILRHNGELLGAFGNFVNRTLVFINKSFQNKVPEGRIEERLRIELEGLYNRAGSKIEEGSFKSALEDIFSSVRNANKYFDDERPWITVKDSPKHCENTLYNCIQLIANFSSLLSPFIPFSCEKLRKLICVDNNQWKYTEIEVGSVLNEPELLFQRIDKKKIDEEEKKLQHQL